MPTRTSSRVTPCAVAPPLSPSQYATHGGECGSSIWRGGSPTQRWARGTTVVGGGSVVVDATPPPSPPPPPPPSPNWLACSDGASVICSLACGLISAMAG